MCPIKIFVYFVIHIITVSSSFTLAAEVAGTAASEAAPRTSDDTGASGDLLSRVIGVPGVWWPAAQILGNTWSLLAAGISSAVVGASFLPRIMPQTRRMDQASERIYRGVVAKPHSWPWIAKLKTTFKRPGAKTRRRACGGALISDRFILTARHCVSWDHNGVVVDGRRVQVWLGSHGREGQDGISIPVKRIIIRPDYQQPQCASGLWCPDWAPWGHTTLTNDIALLELLTPAPASARVRPIALATAPLPPGTTAWVGGWGLDGFHPTRTLNLAPMSVQKDNFRECKQQMSPGKMCVIGKDFGGPCPGDSGSPLVTYSKRTGPQLIGLVSNGAESCKAGLPGIFTRVSHYTDWISLAQDTARRVSQAGVHRDSPRHHPDHHSQSYHHSNNHRQYQSHNRHKDKSNYYSVNKQHFSNFENAFFPPKSKFRPQPSFGKFYHSQYFY